jgi:hypothetical protein
MARQSVFKRRYPVPGATQAELSELIASLQRPLSEVEIATLNASQRNPFPKTDPMHGTYKPFDTRKWLLPGKPLPESHVRFLSWSNGGAFFNRDRAFDPFFATHEIRSYLLSYHIPQYMPGAVPFAFDGAGAFYLFDMRADPVGGEYPIRYVGSGNLNYEDSVLVASSFVEACRGTSNPADDYI